MIWLVNEGYKLELNFPVDRNMSEEEFYDFCVANNELRIERDEKKQIFIMPPAGGQTGRKNSQLVFELELWSRKNTTGITFDSSTGFRLPDGSMRNPDAAWVKKEKWEKLTSAQKEVFPPLTPDFIIELLSPTDHAKEVHEKMTKWITNGVLLAWMIVPKKQAVFIYRADGSMDEIEGFDKKLLGENVLPGFELDLSILL